MQNLHLILYFKMYDLTRFNLWVSLISPTMMYQMISQWRGRDVMQLMSESHHICEI